MAAILDFSKFAFDEEQIRAVKELIYDEVIEAPELSLFHTSFEGIVYDKEVGFIGKGGLVGVAHQGCDPEPQSYNIGTRVIKWEPKGWEIFLEQCRSDIEATAAVYSTKVGVDFSDFTATDYMNIIVERLVQSVKEFAIRLFWFSDTAATNAVSEELPLAAVTNQNEDVYLAAVTTQVTGEALDGTVYLGSATKDGTYTVKTALADGTVVYQKATAEEGNAVAETDYYSRSTSEVVSVLRDTINGTVYEAVTSATVGAVKCALANGTVVYLAAAAYTDPPEAGTAYYSKHATSKVTINSGGNITAALDEDYFTILDGFFKQMITQYTANPAQRVAIAENAGLTEASQALLPANVQGYLKALYYNAPKVLRGNPGGFILCTQSFYDAYEQSLDGTNIESMYRNITDKLRSLTYKSVPLVPIPIWDNIIAECFDNGDALLNPHRAVYTTKEVLAIGVDSMRSFGDMDAWYDKNSRKVKIEMQGKADAKLANPSLFMIAI